MQYLVLEDPTRQYRVGTRLEAAAAKLAANKGVALIPVDPNVYQVHSAVSGFFRSDYGTGWPLPKQAGPICPMTLCLHKTSSAIHWRAAIQVKHKNECWGQVRLTSDSSQYGMMIGVQSDAVELSQYEGVESPFIIGGQSDLSSCPDGFGGFSLWGCGGGIVLWVAISQTVKAAGSYRVGQPSYDV
jgi:hypothetical protein